MNRPFQEVDPAKLDIQFSWIVTDEKGARVDSVEANQIIHKRLLELVPNANRIPLSKIAVDRPLATDKLRKAISDALTKINPTLPMATSALSVGSGGGMTYCMSNGKCHCRWDFTLLHGGRQLTLHAEPYGTASLSIGTIEPTDLIKCGTSSPQCPECTGLM